MMWLYVYHAAMKESDANNWLAKRKYEYWGMSKILISEIWDSSMQREKSVTMWLLAEKKYIYIYDGTTYSE